MLFGVGLVWLGSALGSSADWAYGWFNSSVLLVGRISKVRANKVAQLAMLVFLWALVNVVCAFSFVPSH